MKQMTKCLLGLLAAAVLLAPVSCTKFTDESVTRTVILFIAANNSLSGYSEMNIADLSKGYVPDRRSSYRLVVHLHNYNTPPTLYRVWRDGNRTVMSALKEYDATVSSCSAEHLRDVLTTVQGLYPSSSFGLVMWSHSTGWLPAHYYASHGDSGSGVWDAPSVKLASDGGVSPSSFGSDDLTGGEMEIADVAAAIPMHLDFLIFDSCLMGGAEVAYEFRDKADYIMFSPAEVLAEGMPYAKVMQPLFHLPAREAVIRAAELYYQHYASREGAYASATVSVVDTDELEVLARSCRDIFVSCRDRLSTVETGGIQRYFRFGKYWFYDLEDFVRELAPEQRLLESFSDALGRAVIYRNATPVFIDFPIDSYCGLSTYIQKVAGDPELDAFYRGLQWNKACLMVAE